MGHKWALLIGNSRYDDKEFPPLEKSVADVEALAEVLRDPSIGDFDDIQRLIDQPSDTIRQALDRFSQEKKREDLLLLYLTGHAVRDRRNKWYFVCTDTKSQTLRSTAIPANFIQECMETSQSKQQVIIIDTCHAAAFFEGEKGAADIAEEATRQLAGYGRATLTAAGGTESAWEGDKSTPTSIFTSYLVQGLITGKADKDKDGAITVDEWFDYTCEQVRSANANQTPRKHVEDQHGSIVIAKSPRPIKPSIQYTIPNAYNPSIVRIFREESRIGYAHPRYTIPSGVGFLVSQRHIVTCAHVITEALNIDMQDWTLIPTGQVSLDFPLVARGSVLTAQVIYWLPPRLHDYPESDESDNIAVLELKSALPEAAHAGHFGMVDDLWEHSWQAFGFPAEIDIGLWAHGTVKGKIANNLIQIEGLATLGFSGSPVWSSQSAGIVGMVVAVGRNTKPGVKERIFTNMGYMIPLSDLVKAWPELGQYVVQGEKP